jgi:hypothetical protein
MDRNRWMYGIRRDTIEHLRGVEEYMDYAIEYMSQKIFNYFLSLYLNYLLTYLFLI